ncbi:MAG: TolC family protein, partial [Spartobacteria bacterium]|nr:TolC family protein [Spartobacteria bacterium]
MSAAEWQQVIDGINEKKLPTFSLMGHTDVQLGVLAALAPDCSERLARRLALNIEQIFMGNAPENLQVTMPVDEKLMFNAKTAVEIGYSPSLEVLSSADIINQAAFEKGEQLTVQQAIALALDHNVELAIQKAETEGARAQKNQSMSSLLPNVEGNGRYSKIDNDTAEASMGSAAEEQTQVGLSATQILYNDPVISQYRASQRSYESSEIDQEKVRLDVVKDAADAFIQLLQARALSNIELENLKLTQSNLELARIRYQVGTSGPEEVYRWEAQAASQRASVNDARASVNTARIALNRIMGVDINTDWLPVDIQVTSNNMQFMDARLESMLQTEEQVDLFETFAVEYALRNAEELKSLDKQIQGQEIMLNQYKRRFILPEVSASFTFDHSIDRKYAVDPQTE